MAKRNIMTDIKKFLQKNYNLKRNVITRNVEIDGKPVDDITLNTIFVKCKERHLSATKDNVLSIIYSENTLSYDPFVEFFNSPEHAGLQGGNIDKLIESIESDTPNYDLFIKKWLVSIIASIHGKHSPLILVLCGGQGSGKTEWFRRLLPDSLKSYYAEAGLDDGGSSNKDYSILMTKKLIVLDDEFSSTSKADTKKLKNISSKQTFNIREPYGKVSVDLNRLAVLCGTSNELEVMSDPTGNRRILPLNVIRINHGLYNSICKEALFMELYKLYKSGYSYELSREEIEVLNKSTQDFNVISHEEELINKCYRLPEPHEIGTHKVEYLTATDIINRVGSLTKLNISKQKVGLILKKLGFVQMKKRLNGGGSASRVYELVAV